MSYNKTRFPTMFLRKLFMLCFMLCFFVFSAVCNACTPPLGATRVVADVHGIVVHEANVMPRM